MARKNNNTHLDTVAAIASANGANNEETNMTNIPEVVAPTTEAIENIASPEVESNVNDASPVNDNTNADEATDEVTDTADEIAAKVARVEAKSLLKLYAKTLKETTEKYATVNDSVSAMTAVLPESLPGRDAIVASMKEAAYKAAGLSGNEKEDALKAIGKTAKDIEDAQELLADPSEELATFVDNVNASLREYEIDGSVIDVLKILELAQQRILDEASRLNLKNKLRSVKLLADTGFAASVIGGTRSGSANEPTERRELKSIPSGVSLVKDKFHGGSLKLTSNGQGWTLTAFDDGGKVAYTHAHPSLLNERGDSLKKHIDAAASGLGAPTASYSVHAVFPQLYI